MRSADCLDSPRSCTRGCNRLGGGAFPPFLPKAPAHLNTGAWSSGFTNCRRVVGAGFTPLYDGGGSGCVSCRGAGPNSSFTHWRTNCSFGPGGSSGRGRQSRSLANRRREEERRWQERPRGRSRCAGTETGDGRPPLLSASSLEVRAPGRTRLCY